MSIHENISDLISQVSKLDFNRVTVKDFKIQELTEAKPKYKNNGLDLYLTVFTEDNDSDGFYDWMDKLKIIAFNLDYVVIRRRLMDDSRVEFFLRHDVERQGLLHDLLDRYEHTSLEITVKHVQQVVKWPCKTTFGGGFNVVIASSEDVIMCDNHRVQNYISTLGYRAGSVYCGKAVRDWTVTKKGE